MNAVHLHLMLNHAPLFGVLAGLLLLAWGVFRNSREVRFLSYAAFVLSALSAIAVYLTGGAAEALVEDLPGITEAAIERHEEIAKIALGLACLSGIVALIAFYAERGTYALRKPALTSLFLIGVIALGTVEYAANLGGQIRHPEITAHK